MKFKKILPLILATILLTGCGQKPINPTSIPTPTIGDNITITFSNGGGSGTMDSVTISTSSYTLPHCRFTAPEGKEFAGWDVNGEIKQPGDIITLSSSVTITATWKQIVFTVVFDPADGSGVINPITINKGGILTLPECTFVAPFGQEFAGWIIDGKTYQVGETITITKNLLVSATWKDVLVTISFNANGGTGTIDSVQIKYGQSFTLPTCTFTAPEGKEFAGWSIGGVIYQVGEAIVVRTNTIIAPYWKDIGSDIVFVTVSFSAGEGTGTMNNVTVIKDSSYLLPECDFTSANQEFDGWLINNEVKQPGETITIGGNTTLTATWKDIKFTISFVAGEGTGTMNSVEVKSGSSYTLPNCSFVAPSGKEFDGWLINETKKEASSSITITSDIIITATWKDIVYTIVFDANGGSGTMASVNKKQGETYTLPSCTFTAPENKEFANWLIGAEEKQPNESIIINSNITIKANWKDIKYTITFSAGEGTGTMNSVEVVSGSSYTLPSCTFTAPTGKEFDSWTVGTESKSVGETITVTSNITITATWKTSGGGVPSTEVTTSYIEGIPEDFIMGMDASAVPSLENSGVKYYNESGTELDAFKILADHGVNYIRVRVWNDPYDSDGHGYGGGNCDINNALIIGKRATQYGMKLLVDFHYSDFWADPAKQKAPKAWADYTLEQKKTALYNYTKDSLNLLKTNNVDVGMVQVGNETNQMKMCGETDRSSVGALMNQGSKAIREVYPTSKVAVHFTDPQRKVGSTSFPKTMASYLNQYNVDYDVYGTSYYPYWHGTLDNLSTVLSEVASTYNKEVMVMETSYANTMVDTDSFGNKAPNTDKDYPDSVPYDVSLQGQYDSVHDLIKTIAKDTTKGIGVCYWEGTWISVNKGSWSANEALWTQYGSGWASKYANGYDSEAPAQYSEGCDIDNQAFFNKNGKVLPSLDVFLCGNEQSYTPVDPVTPEEKVDVTINLTLTTPPSTNVSIIYDINRSIDSDWINNDGTWIEMNNNENTYSYTIKDVSINSELRFVFVTWDNQNLFVCYNEWLPYLTTIDGSKLVFNCSASSFPSSDSEAGQFIVE